MSTSGRTTSRIRLSQVRSAWPPVSSTRIRLVLAKRDLGALADREMAERLRDVCFSDPDRSEQSYGLARVQPARGRQGRGSGSRGAWRRR